MAKRTSKQIVLGSGKVYLMVYDGSTMPTTTQICIDANLLGYIKGGATLTYTETTYEEKDDLGYVHKIITTDEEAKLKLGLITFNGVTLTKLVDRGSTTEADGIRTTKIGGAGNAQGKNYVVCFEHEDATDGNIWVMIAGRNTAGLSLAWSTGAGTQVEPEFTAIPHDSDGTLIEYIEQTAATPSVAIPETAAIVASSVTVLSAAVTPETSASSVTWSTDDASGDVITISGSGAQCTVTGVAAGTATVIAAIVVGGTTYSDSCEVTVIAGS